ncbi:hypothetical protein [Sphingobacterium gobiense]|uniref:Uncharacterized protein n=1 Tax=Sphingobacterium gobiense TaxID=1382456 RepID=A0A2S9JGG7_9SPHI|nr:hypothetical protein [Sphingobacterium gobiense]PRD52040.1 hypothetical protein C5749_17240 [Sphingobacterium gobiense]
MGFYIPQKFGWTIKVKEGLVQSCSGSDSARLSIADGVASRSPYQWRADKDNAWGFERRERHHNYDRNPPQRVSIVILALTSIARVRDGLVRRAT